MRSDFGYFEEEKLGKAYDAKMLKRLYPFLKPHKTLILGSILLVILITLVELSLPYVTKIAIDRYIVPVMDAAQAAGPDAINADRDKKRLRYLKADITDSAIAAVVAKYPERFRIEGNSAFIFFDDLPHLAPKDLARLRRDDLAGVSGAAAVYVALVLASFGLNFVQVMVMEYTGQMIMHDLRVRLFEHIQNLSVSFFNRNPVGRLVTRVTNDVQNMHELFTSVISFVFKDLFLLFGIAIVLLGLNWKLALASFTVLPFVLIAAIKFSRRAREIFRVLRIKVAEINTRFAETIGGMNIIQLFGQEKENYRSFAHLNHENYRAGMRQIRILAVFMPFVEVLGVIAVAIVVCYGGSGVLAHHLTLGALVAFISYLKMFFRPIRDIAEKYNILQNAMASAERIFLILDDTEHLAPAVPLATPPRLNKIAEIVFEEVSFSYVKDEPILKQVYFQLKAGETIAVVGPTGSGKTTLINLITRFYDPTSGRILINGNDIRNWGVSMLRSKMALVMQDPFLFSETIRDNIFHGDHGLTAVQIEAVLKAANCKTLIDRLPEGLDTMLAEGGTSISSGQRQLISIARAFARDPDLIILDEATSYVDSETEHKIQEAVAHLMKGRTSIVVAHRLATARRAEKIIVLNRGRIMEYGNHAELMQERGFYYKLNQLQT